MRTFNQLLTGPSDTEPTHASLFPELSPVERAPRDACESRVSFICALMVDVHSRFRLKEYESPEYFDGSRAGWETRSLILDS